MKMKMGIWTIEINKDGKSWIEDGWASQSITFYKKGKWASDNPEKLPKYIKNFLCTIEL